ncbi:unnamed protein product [Penicillium bialowiezense]
MTLCKVTSPRSEYLAENDITHVPGTPPVLTSMTLMTSSSHGKSQHPSSFNPHLLHSYLLIPASSFSCLSSVGTKFSAACIPPMQRAINPSEYTKKP